MFKVHPKTLMKINELFELAKGNDTCRSIFEKLDGCDTAEAYAVLKTLDDQELKIMAAMIGIANQKFGRVKEVS